VSGDIDAGRSQRGHDVSRGVAWDPQCQGLGGGVPSEHDAPQRLAGDPCGWVGTAPTPPIAHCPRRTVGGCLTHKWVKLLVLHTAFFTRFDRWPPASTAAGRSFEGLVGDRRRLASGEQPSAPTVAAVTLRRVRLLAPAAVRMRMSPAVSLRISPAVIASTPRARRMPAAVA
jgi:hypothetical protein